VRTRTRCRAAAIELGNGRRERAEHGQKRKENRVNPAELQGVRLAPRRSRRELLGGALRLLASAALAPAATLLAAARPLRAADSPGAQSELHETYRALLAFLVPGTDVYSQAQGLSSRTPGGSCAGVTELLISSLDASVPHVPHFSALFAALLNDTARELHPETSGEFSSRFACLAFGAKAEVFAALDSQPDLAPLAGILPVLAVDLVYNEAGVFDPERRALTGRPIGWALTNYPGVADGRDGFIGYFEGRRRAQEQ
jgi:hypothetical protein